MSIDAPPEPKSRPDTRLQSRGPGSKHRPTTVDELTERNVAAVAQLEDVAKAKRTSTDCVVDAITGFCGSMGFVWVHAAWFAAWVLINTLPFVPRRWHFDPYPFQFLTLAVSLEAIFLSTFILISQNRSGRVADRRNHLDLQVNLLSEQENTKMLSMLASIQKHLGVPESDPEAALLEESTQPERLVQQIEKVIDREDTDAQTDSSGHDITGA